MSYYTDLRFIEPKQIKRFRMTEEQVQKTKELKNTLPLSEFKTHIEFMTDPTKWPLEVAVN